MRLLKVRLQNYRSIVDSGGVNIEDVVTVLIGKQEQGKTNFLKGLRSFNEQHRRSSGDLPNHLRANLESKDPAEIPIVTLWLAPESSEQEKMKQILEQEQLGDEYKIIRYSDGHYEYYSVDSKGREFVLEFPPPDISSNVDQLKAASEDLRGKLKIHGERSAEFAKAIDQVNKHVDSFVDADFSEQSQIRNVIKTFSAALKGLPGQDKPIQKDIATAINQFQTAESQIIKAMTFDPLATFRAIIPSFVFHSSTLDMIPNEVKVADFVADPEGTSKGMADLCGVAGLSTQKIQELADTVDTSHREAYEDHYRASISGGINEFWTQDKYNVHFRIEREKLSVSISDSTYSPRIPPTERSDGFQWYLSFYCALVNEASPTSHTVVLLDNPGLELHADGQRDIKRLLEEKLPSSTQVIYVTHSPAMVDPFYLEQVRTVEKHGNQVGTKVSNWAFKEGPDADLLEPVRSAIGASLVTSLVFADFNILVEGAADKPILEGAFAALHGQEARRVLVNGSVAESPEGFLPRFYQRSGLPFVICVDADSGGRELVRDLKKWGIPEANIVDLKKVFPDHPGKEFELEDILSAEFYHMAVSETYPDKTVKAPEGATGKVTKVYEREYSEAHKIGFNKRRVGETVKKLLTQERGDKKTLDSLKILTVRILEACEAQQTKSSSREPKAKPVPKTTGSQDPGGKPVA